MRVIQLSPRSWLVLDDAIRPRWLIVKGPMVEKATGETHMVHRVEHWNHEASQRSVLAVCDGEMAARAWCEHELEEEAARSAAKAERVRGRDPATGLPYEQFRRLYGRGAGPGADGGGQA